MLARLAAAGLALLVQIVLARVLGVPAYGQYVFIIAWVMILAKLATLGFDTSLVRFAAAYSETDDFAALKGLWRWSNLLVTGTAASVLAALAILVAGNATLSFSPAEYAGLALIPLLALTALRQALMQSQQRVVRALLPDSFLRPLLLLAAIAVWVWVLGYRPDLSDVLSVQVAAAAASLVLGSLMVVNMTRRRLASREAEYRGREWLRTSIPLLVTSSLVLIQNQTDVLMLGLLADRAHSGIYAVSARLSETVTYGIVAVNAIFAPLCAGLYARGEREDLQQLMRRAARTGFLLAAVISLLLLALAKPVLGLFGPVFVTGFAVLGILLLGQLFSAGAGSVGMIMAMTRHQVTLAWLSSGSLVLNILLNALLIPLWDMTGAAIATTVSTIAWNLGGTIFLARRERLHSSVLPS
jgi:O-antigen/teichoic acid export membrane protein